MAAALERGAVAVGVSSADVDADLVARMQAAIARGDLATWKYDTAYAQAICDPSVVLSGARSVFCFALAYAHPNPLRPQGFGRISNYVWGRDYHRAMRQLLDGLIAELQRIAPDTQALAVCDTKPLAERAFAVRAGLGWIGKHTNMIVPGIGSYVFLGEIVTDLALPADLPRKTHCGSCRLCVTQCPTGALRGDYSMDATRCISDLTQRRDAIPRNLRPLMGQWIWGCDICQDACPPVARAGYHGHAAFAPNPAPYPKLTRLLTLSPLELKREYGETAMSWRGATVLRRNAAIALGNGHDRADVPALLAALRQDGSALVRGHVAWALGRIGSPTAYAGLRDAALVEEERSVREEIFAAIGDIRGTTSVQSSMENSLCV